MAEYLKAIVTVNNRTSWSMNLQDARLDWGKWVTAPPLAIGPGESAVFQSSGRAFTPSGTQGSVTYSLAGNPQNATATMTFDVPFAGKDTAGISSSPPEALSVETLQSEGNENHIRFNVAPPAVVPLPGPIKNVFVLLLENRSFDHMLGFSAITGKNAEDGSATTIDGLSGSESNSFQGESFQVSDSADLSMPVDPGHEFDDVVQQLAGDGVTYPRGGPYPAIDNSGFVASYAQNKGGGGRGGVGEIMKCFDSQKQLPVLYALATEFALCDHWYASMPGPTWPNRFFAAAASSGGLDHSPTAEDIAAWMGPDGFIFENGTIFDLLRSHGLTWRIYRGDNFPINAALKGISVLDTFPFARFAGDVSNSVTPYPISFTFIEPNYGNFLMGTYLGGSSQHPIDDVTRGEALIKSVYEAIRNSPIWETSLLIVTWDEHGGFYDHFAPPPAPAPGDKVVTPLPPLAKKPINQFGFDFVQYGVRVPAVIVSAYTPRNLIDHRTYDHASIPATTEAIFNLPPLTERDKLANSVTTLISLENPRPDAPERLPDPIPGVPPARMMAMAAATPPAVSVDDQNLPGFLHVAMRSDLELSPPEERPAIVARVESIKTRAEATEYIQEVDRKIAALDARR